ncbi:HAD-IB family phosphatase [Rhodococcus sp. 3Y1]
MTLDAMMTEFGTCGAAGDVDDGAPLALFDWDNTVVKNDIGSATAFWMIKNNKVLQPAGGDWATTSRFMTPAGAAALSAACGSETAPGQPLATSTDLDCADEIVAVLERRLATGRPHSTVTITAGQSRIRVGRAVDGRAHRGRDHRVRSRSPCRESRCCRRIRSDRRYDEVDGSVRYYAQIEDLVKSLGAHGFDVRIISASAEPVVRVWAEQLGLDADHVMGVRPIVEGGVLTGRLRGCGGVADGDDSVIPYIDGKRCQVNEVVYGVQGPTAFEQLAADRRQVFAAGDSVTDVTFLGDATGARLVINRNNPELMCNAYDNSDGKWLVNPMFIEPKSRADAPYRCSTDAYTDAAGAKVP